MSLINHNSEFPKNFVNFSNEFLESEKRNFEICAIDKKQIIFHSNQVVVHNQKNYIILRTSGIIILSNVSILILL
jgi:hypothetical protein